MLSVMLLMKRLRTLSDRIAWHTEQRDQTIARARRDHGFSRGEIADATGLSERQISRIADAYEPSPYNAAPDMASLRRLCDGIAWDITQRDRIIGTARRDHKFTRKEIAAASRLSERQISRIADDYDGTKPDEAYYPPGTDRPHFTPPDER